MPLRAGRTGLAHFLSKAQVPGYKLGGCSCGEGRETLRHVIVYRPKKGGRRGELREFSRRLDFVRLLDSSQGAAITSRWRLRPGKLPSSH